MKDLRIYIDCFDSAGYLRGRARTYEAIKVAVLEAGRYSVFEATETRENARLFHQLHHDSEIEIVDMAFPWVGVRPIHDAVGQPPLLVAEQLRARKKETVGG